MKNKFPVAGYINTAQYGTIPVLDIPMRDDNKDKKAPCQTAKQSTEQKA